jgi:excisionase family DNA binding protein
MEPNKPGSPSRGPQGAGPKPLGKPADRPGSPPPQRPGPQPSKAAAGQQLLTAAEAAQILGLPVEEVQRMAQRGVLPGTRATGQWLCPRPMLEAWQKQQQARKSAPPPPKLIDERPNVTSTESYDLSVLEDLDLPDI